MANEKIKIKDFAKSFSLDPKELSEYIDKNIENKKNVSNDGFDIATANILLFKMVSEIKNLASVEQYFKGETKVPNGKKPKPKKEPPKEEPKAEKKETKEEKPAETKKQTQETSAVQDKKAEQSAKPQVKEGRIPENQNQASQNSQQVKQGSQNYQNRAQDGALKQGNQNKFQAQFQNQNQKQNKNAQNQQNKQNNQFGQKRNDFYFDKDKDDDYENKRPQFTVKPKVKKPESNVIEIKKKTGTTRVVDTRGSNVDLSKYDEKLDSFGTFDNYGSSKQKLKKQNNKDNYSSKKDKERLAQEKLKRAIFEKAKNTQLSITVPDEISVGELAVKLKVTSNELVKKLMMMGVMASINQVIDYDTAYLVADELGAKVTKEVVVTIEEKLFEDDKDDPSLLQERAPVVCVMGHVDHGKTSLLDAIRNTNVTSGEAGGITQHIGAYSVHVKGKDITFLDTPGHEAFTAMRLRGAMATDIAIIVVAADDGIMPQTVEAINHAKSAGVDIIVAINKMDKPTANPDAIKQELTKYDLVPEEWGGDVICVPVSAKTKEGIDNLLETILLVAEVKELKANPNRHAKGIVIEAKLDKGRGPVATILIQNGTLKSGDVVIAGTSVGRVRAMSDYNGKVLKEAGPSVPVEIIGLDAVPQAGDEFNAVDDEKMARTLADQRREKAKEEEFKANSKVNLDDLFNQINEGKKEINVIIKADVGGSAEAVKSSLLKLSNDEVKISVIHTGVGGIVDSDVMLAAASNAVIIGFNVRPDKSALDSAARQNVDIRTHRIIYEIIEEMEAAMKGMLSPSYKEVIYGHAQVRQTIRVPSVGTIAGSYVQDGKVTRSSQIRVLRDGVVIFEDRISSLRRFKDDVKEVAAGYECGIGLEKFNDINEGDILEAFGMEEIQK